MRNTRKILVALLVLMTLMVGMFAVTASAAAGETWTVAGSSTLCGSNWTPSDKKNDMTYDAATDSYVKVYTNVKAGTYEFKCVKNHAWGTEYPGSNYLLKVEKDGSTVTITLKGTNVNAKVEAPSCDHKYEITGGTVTCLTAGTRIWTCSVCNDSYTENLTALGHHYDVNGKCERCDETTQVVRVYLDNAANWAEVYCYSWDTNPYVAWPGEKMAKDEATGLYYYDIPTIFVNTIFNKGVGGEGNQSADLKTPTGKAVVYNNSTNTWGELPHVHNFVEGKCECGESDPNYVPPHVHSWSNATCTEPQKCECGETQGEALGHSFAEGTCSVCGATDPDYVAPEKPEESDKVTYVFNSDDLTAFDGDKAKGEELVVGTNDFFTLIFATNSKTQEDSKTFDDGNSFTQRLSFNGNSKVDGGYFTRTIKFTTNGPATITIWWNCGADGRNIEIYTWDGENDPVAILSSPTDTVKSGLYVTTFEIEAAGTYYLGHTAGTSYFYKVALTQAPDVCQHEYEENIFYHPEMVSATCTTPGVAVFECIHCDHYYTEATPIDPTAHGWNTSEEVVTAATCTENGVKKVTCADCNTTWEEEIYACHTLEETIVNATCTTGGSYHAVCTVCGYEENEVSEPQGHSNWYLTCGQTGECMECGVEFTMEHQGDPATCTDPMFCYNCWSSVGEALGHNYVLDVCLVCYDIKPSYQIGENAITGGTTNGAFGMFVVEEAGTYWVVSNNGSLACIFTTPVGLDADFSIAADGTLGASWYAFSIMPVELQPGLYYAAGYGVGDYTLTIMRHDEHAFVEGKCACGAVDPDYVPPHEHSFVEGKCECGEVDPNYTKPEQPAPEQPAPEQPAPEVELSLFEQIMKTINELIAKITAWFKGFVAGLKK